MPALQSTPAREQFLDALQGGFDAARRGALRGASVAVAGCGGLGSNIAVWLARAGVGRLHLVDFDTVELSNLNRQQFELADLGVPKVDALAARIARVNPYARVTVDRVRLDAENAAGLLGAFPLVAEAFDDPAAKATLVDTLLALPGGPVVVGASGMAGWGPAGTIATRRVTGRFYLCGDESADVATTPALLASRVAVCAGHQATALIRLILGEEP